ncbi:MAG TPA: nucleotidyltransferase family protein [Candidatus Polarisedimenticolia bacterium]|nr:nucleotidyltransferase family protein [Candidatus Polarisedimenticolia bacterium]
MLLSLLGRGAASQDGLARVPPAELVDLCRRHRVSGLVYPNVGPEIPQREAILPALRDTVRKTLVDNLILLKALHEVAATLSEEGIGFVLLKGVSLLGFLYPEIQLRPMTDVDLLLREKDWPKVADTLRQRGYRMPPEEEERFYRDRWYHQLVESPGTPTTNLEFHWNLESVERSRIDPDDLIHDAVPCEIEGDPFLRLCDDHLFIHLAVHLAHHYQSPALVWVEDLRRLLAAGNLDWDRIARTARTWGVENCLAYSLGYVERAFPGSIPPRARGFRFSPARRLILGAFSTENPVLPHRPLEGRALRHAVSMVLMDRWSDVARYVAVHAFMRSARATGMRPAL